MAQLVTLMIASLEFSIFGSVTVSHRISSLPCQTRAFIVKPPTHTPSEGGNSSAADGCFGSQNNFTTPNAFIRRHRVLVRIGKAAAMLVGASIGTIHKSPDYAPNFRKGT